MGSLLFLIGSYIVKYVLQRKRESTYCRNPCVPSLSDIQQLGDDAFGRSVVDLQGDDDILDPIVPHHLGEVIFLREH